MLYLAGVYLGVRDRWPDGAPVEVDTGSVLWVETESSEALNVGRAFAWDYPRDRFLTPFHDPLVPITFGDPSHMDAIRAVASREEVKAVFVDSLSGGAGGRENKAGMVQTVAHFAGIARDFNKPVALAHHIRKRNALFDDPAEGLILDHLRGHSGIVQPCRVIIGLDRPNGIGSTMRRLKQIKNSLRAFPLPLGMELIPGLEDDVHLSFGEAPEIIEELTGFDLARDFLHRFLDKAPRAAKDVLKAAAEAKIPDRTLYRAKKALRIASPKVGGIWMWSLPAREEE